MENNANIVNNILGVIHDENSIFDKTCNIMTNKLIKESNNLINVPNVSMIKNNDMYSNETKLINPIQENIGGGNGTNNNLSKNVNLDTNVVLGTEIIIPKTQTYQFSFLGYEFSIWTLILVLIIVITVIYFLYKWFFSPSTEIVSFKKSNKLSQFDDKKLNDVISENSTENSTDTSSTNSTNSKTSKNNDIEKTNKDV